MSKVEEKNKEIIFKIYLLVEIFKNYPGVKKYLIKHFDKIFDKKCDQAMYVSYHMFYRRAFRSSSHCKQFPFIRRKIKNGIANHHHDTGDHVRLSSRRRAPFGERSSNTPRGRR